MTLPELQVVGALGIATHQPRGIFLALGFGQERCAVDTDGLLADLFEPLNGTLVAVGTDLRHLLRIVDTEKMVDGDVDGHHQYQLKAVAAFGIENGLAVVTTGQVGAHFGDGSLFAYLHDGMVLTDKGIEYFAVDAGIVVFGVDEFAHVR